MKYSIKENFSWIFFITKRYAQLKKRGAVSSTSLMSTLGIGFGVLALIVIMAVMNGFQNGSIESILQINSYHVQGNAQSWDEIEQLENDLSENSLVKTLVPFFEAQGLMVGRNGRQSAVLLRSLPEDILYRDEDFKNQLTLYGTFDLRIPRGIVLGYSLATQLGVSIGDEVSLLALSGSSDVALFSADRKFIVTGLFYTGYEEINSLFAFISQSDGVALLGDSAVPTLGIKLKNKNTDRNFLQFAKEKFPSATFGSWREYNRAFFGALQIEKNILMLLVLLIFVVVGVNIFNGMRRLVFEKHEEIALLSALGATPFSIQLIFIFQGLLIGLRGAIPGLLLGLLLSVRIDLVFGLISKISYGFQYFFTMLFQPEMAYLVRENSIFNFYAQIPAIPFLGETAFITLFGIISALFAAFLASKKALAVHISEVLRNE
ncbi:MAG: ABC transporter permease [Spirochaetaceae bacterium]|nr:ABC transporter permease [Spirochaetaceae bacterium]